ncbi:MAG TPA: family 43 glycosylhydrolase, partial [Sediminibacterium sp.]|nr:family 43 glycosylhydrolase [Sediminibacterium sp.]
GIDPNVFIDRNGQAYLYWAEGNIYVAKLKENMLELASDPMVIPNLPEKGLKEGPFLFERNGMYYLTYPHVANKTERLEYAIADNPMGPFQVKGVIMDESPTGCWTNHQSIVQFLHQWYLFYHHNDLSPQFDKNRSIRADSLFFEPDGTIRKVIPSLRGVGLTQASDQIQVDRYTRTSETGVHVAFLDSANHFAGWKAVMTGPDAWIQYNSVDFGKRDWRNIQLRVQAPQGGKIQVRTDKPDGPVIATCVISKDSGWITYLLQQPKTPQGIHHLFIIQQTDHPVAVDWIHFD